MGKKEKKRDFNYEPEKNGFCIAYYVLVSYKMFKIIKK